MASKRKAAAEHTEAQQPGAGRSMRQRKNQGPYMDDDPSLLASLAYLEAEHTARPYRVDQEAATMAGLQPHKLHPFERACNALPAKLKQNAARLTTIRNHILGRAQKTPSKFLTLADAIRGLGSEFRGSGAHAADAASVYTCLNHHNYINVGVMDDHPQRLLGRAGGGCAAGFPEGTRLRVVVIGAGASGLAAARQLALHGHEVIVLEGRERIGARRSAGAGAAADPPAHEGMGVRLGGRVHTASVRGASVDLGAMVVTGVPGNPMAALARQTK